MQPRLAAFERLGLRGPHRNPSGGGLCLQRGGCRRLQSTCCRAVGTRAPLAGDTDEKYCGAHKLIRPDGTVLPHSETPMEWVLRTGKPARDIEVIIEWPDTSRVTVLVNIA